jgi:hypothetical protein
MEDSIINIETVGPVLIRNDYSGKMKIMGLYDDYNAEIHGEITDERIRSGEILAAFAPARNQSSLNWTTIVYYVLTIGICVPR